MIVIFLSLIQVIFSQPLSSLKQLSPPESVSVSPGHPLGPLLTTGGLWAPGEGCSHIRAWGRVASCCPLMGFPRLSLLFLFPLHIVQPDVTGVSHSWGPGSCIRS